MVRHPKPPGLTPEYAAQFQDASIVEAYKYREPYPPETFDILRRLAGSHSPHIADIGCGSGDLASGMSRFAHRVDAIDISKAMLEEAQRVTHDAPNIHWIHSPAETAPVEGPYDLITAADSIHWMDWEALFRNMRGWLKQEGFFCVVTRWYENNIWWDEAFQEIVKTYSTNRDFKKYDIIEALKKSGFVTIEGSTKTKPVAFTQPLDSLIGAFHSRNGFSRDRMGQLANSFDEAARRHLSRFATDGDMKLQSAANITWMKIN